MYLVFRVLSPVLSSVAFLFFLNSEIYFNENPLGRPIFIAEIMTCFLQSLWPYKLCHKEVLPF